MSGRTPEERAAYRAFVKAHHPDRGGDPDAFVAGIQELKASPPPTTDPPVVVVRRPRGVRRIAVQVNKWWRRRRRTRVV
ncbi:hypothetical protein EV193_102619 [Herbihabitans rhizosphaerae]|uniref:J domain-containing protein n=1 Tax=Herbihabitans rhizosphaerae TaxID=1872711 RepID=A0A4Q7L264_9PSEU|nr:hypothetical protein [Herbihabitans rhizosphaerae]RZS43638.1 hypothetical protein EV193_102619 [Herbihabitans rhizosphaerae]